MRERSRGIAVGGLVVLVGALVIGFATTQPWVHLGTSVLDVFGISPSVSVRFGDVPLGSVGGPDLAIVLLGGDVLLAVLAVLLVAVRGRGPRILLRLGCGLLAAAAGVVAIGMWVAIGSPATIGDLPNTNQVIDTAARLLALARDGGVLDVAPGTGLWLLTIGAGLALVGACLPAVRTAPRFDGRPAAAAGQPAASPSPVFRTATTAPVAPTVPPAPGPVSPPIAGPGVERPAWPVATPATASTPAPVAMPSAAPPAAASSAAPVSGQAGTDQHVARPGETQRIPMQRSLPAGWYPDRAAPGLLRWFDGTRWTDAVRRNR